MSSRGLLAGLLPALLLLAGPLAGCGAGEASPDLFLVERSGPAPAGRLSMVVSEEGGLSCNRGPKLMLDDAQIIKARTIAEELQGPVSHHLDLPANPGSVYAYRVRNEEGAVSFADNSTARPKVFDELELFVSTVAQQLCHVD